MVAVEQAQLWWKKFKQYNTFGLLPDSNKIQNTLLVLVIFTIRYSSCGKYVCNLVFGSIYLLFGIHTIQFK